jgi:hypothetical protein
MLDKGQITDWEGEPEGSKEPKPVPVPKPPEPARGAISAAIFDSREALPTGEFVKVTPEQAAARKRRGHWIAIALFAFVIVVFVLTMTKMGAQVLVRNL